MARTTRRESKSHADRSVTKVARTVLVARFAKLEKAISKVRKVGPNNVDAIHDLRTASRRMAAAVELYSDWLPKRSHNRLADYCDEIRSATGDVREMDVYLEWVVGDARHFQSDALLWLVRQICARRHEANADMLREVERLAKNRFLKVGESVENRIHWRGKDSEPSVFEHASRSIEAFADDLVKFQKKLRRPDKLHSLRILCKGIRYSLEFFSDILSPQLANSACQRLTSLQDRLGELHDGAEFAERLQKWSDDCDDKAICKALMRMSERETHAMNEQATAMLDSVARELTPLVTMLRQLAPST